MPDHDTHGDFRAAVRKFARAELAEGYPERARSEEFFWDVYAKLGAQGLLGLGVSEEHGGQGADSVACGIACEELGRADFNVGFAVFGAITTGGLLDRAGTDEVRTRWLPGVLDGSRLLALALTEPDSGSDAAALRTKAVRTAGGWLLTGEKTSSSMAGHAHGIVVFARAGDGVTAFLVEADAPGVSRYPIRDAGFRPTGRASVALEDVFVPDANLLGEAGGGFRLVMRAFDHTRALLGLLALGTAQAALAATVEYTKQRYAFGQPVARFEGVSFQIAEHATRLEAARALCYRALELREAGEPHVKEAAMVKWWAPHTAVRAIHDCVVLHGHIGYSEDLPLQQMQRDVSGLEIGDGTPHIQKMIIAREIFGRAFLPYEAGSRGRRTLPQGDPHDPHVSHGPPYPRARTGSPCSTGAASRGETQ
jgi:cyclohexanecarboxyl-CoA dehydrogenase